MAQYIPKKSLVAEIEKLISNGKLKCKQSQENNDRESYIAWSEHIATCGKILSFLNTLEVKEIDTEQLNKLLNWWKGVTTDYSAYKMKEVDFEKELDRIWFDNKLGDYFDNDALDFAHIRTLCRHFFELGIKVQKGE